MAELPLDKVLDFLKKIRPFSQLSDSLLKDVATSLMIEYFPGKKTILFPGPVTDPFLYLIFSGVGRCFSETDAGVETLRYVSEGDHFGSETIITGECEHGVQVQEDMICYLVRPEVFADVEMRSEEFSSYFRTLHDSVGCQISGYRDYQWETAPLQALWDKSSSSQFKTPIRALIGREPVCCEPHTTVGEIARIMERTGVGSVIVVEDERPAGIITKNDLTWKILARERGSDVKASEIMSANPVAMDFSESCFEASMRMVENRCHHMLATQDGTLRGVISQHDLILLQGANPVAVVQGVDKQTDLAGIKTCVDQMSIVQQGLLAQGGGMDEVWTLMSSFRDAVTRRLLVIAIEALQNKGKETPVLEFSWITFGTPGRRETLLNSNFLEGFVYKDVEKGLEDESRTYVTALVSMVQEGLVGCGLLDRHHGRVLCIPESQWEEQLLSIADGNAYSNEDPLRVLDLRGIGKHQELVHGFRVQATKAICEKPGLLDRMRAAHDVTAIPQGIYRDQVVTSQGQQERLNLKQDVLTPLVSAIRLLTLERDIMATSTKDRIEALCSMDVLGTERAEDLQVIYPWLVEICLIRALDQGRPLNWILDPRHCSSEEKRLLTESFRIVKETVEKAS
ncbi:MAG: CBS domain-containing protein [Deltaproteobacteria bacterium]|nr:CBS domain-containing protein [Deltaproteobacteria bacterium]